MHVRYECLTCCSQLLLLDVMLLQMDKAVGHIDLNKVMHVRAHPIGYKNDESFYYFEVHFTATGKVAFPSPWELRIPTLVCEIVIIPVTVTVWIKSAWVNLLACYTVQQL